MRLPLQSLLVSATFIAALWLPDREDLGAVRLTDMTDVTDVPDILPATYISPEFLTVTATENNETLQVAQLDQIRTKFYEFGIVRTVFERSTRGYLTRGCHDSNTTISLAHMEIQTKHQTKRHVLAPKPWVLVDYDAILRLRPKRLRPVSRRALRRAFANARQQFECTFEVTNHNYASSLSQNSLDKTILNATLTCLKVQAVSLVIGSVWRCAIVNPNIAIMIVVMGLSQYVKVTRFLVMLVACLCVLPCITATKDDEGSSLGQRCPIFEGVTASFVTWLISFTAWVAWKAPELVPILNGSLPMPVPANAQSTTPNEAQKIKKWKLNNTQLYGAVVSHVATPIQASLHVQANGDGLGAITYLKQRYGSQSTGDRAEATARLQRSHIDPRAKLSESDIMKQYNEMSLAAADIIAAGGNRPDDELLISMFENALPPTYAMIRQMVRYSKHTRFEDYYNDFLSQVKAEERAVSLNAAPTVFVASRAEYNQSKGGKGRGLSRGGRGGGKESQYSPCFNCGKSDHLRFRCPIRQRTICKYCNSNHLSELCPKGPGGALRDSLNDTARAVLDKQANNKSQPPHNGELYHQAYSTSVQNDSRGDWLEAEYQAFLSRKRPLQSGSEYPVAKESRIVTPSMHASARPSNSLPTHPQQANPTGSTAHAASSQCSSGFHELDEFFDAVKPHVHFADVDKAYAGSVHAKNVHHIAFIDSQATNFVVPSPEYLTRVTDESPIAMVDTANGAVRPVCVGDTTIQMFNDRGDWYSFDVSGVWVLPGCDRILYSQAAMSKLGVVHRLDEGYILLPDGSKKSIAVQSYSMEISFPIRSAHAASTLSIPLPRNIARQHIGTSTGDRASVPQQLVWQRLGFPSKHIWLRITDVLRDHGLPDNAHLKHEFPMLEAVARARARAKPFNDLRDPDHLPAPGAVIYMDFAGPLIASYPHGYRYYCGAVDSGSGLAKILPCHEPIKVIAVRCLESLLADMRLLMGLSHKLRPQVIVSDQGTQFMSHHFRDFLADEQIRHYPATVYTPQQNSTVERMWGTRFSTARVLLKFSNLGPRLHPFALQCANWICNRLPQSSRANLSAWYILSRMQASIGYLKSFGCLVRMTIPFEKREGDKHFSDRGVLGIYLGPSEQSPGCIVYVPSTRKFYVTRDVICYEDVHPGIKHIDSSWIDVEAGARSEPLIPPESSNIDGSTVSAPVVTTLPDERRESVEHQSPTGVDMEDDRVDDLDQSVQNPNVSTVGEESNTTALNLPNLEDVPDNTTDVTQYDPTTDPSSRQFRRVLPHRTKRYQGAYGCQYFDPLTADRDQSVHNAVQLTGSSLGVRNDIVAYESTVAGLQCAHVVTTTNEMGQVQIPRGYHHSLRVPEAKYWREAILKEYKGLMDIGTFEFVKRSDVPKHANVMRCHLVFALKRNDDGSIDKFKARLVADGNTQRYGVDFDRVFSTVAKLSTLRLVLIVAAAYDYNATSIDIRQAYLQAELNEELYMEVPPGLPNINNFGEPLVTRLRRSLYGLKQAGREWHILLTNTLKEWGFTQSSIDVCLFSYSRFESRLLIVVWVDDCVILDNDHALRSEFVNWLSNRFPVEDKHELNWILHVKVTRDRGQRALSLSQELYVKDLLSKYAYLLDGLTRRFDSPHDATITLTSDQCPAPDTPEHECMHRHRDDYMSLVGAFLWLSNVTRPDLAYIAGQLARYVNNPGMPHYKAALRVLIYLRGTVDQVLSYKPNGDRPLRAFVDANWAIKFSVSGGMMEFMGCLVHWLSRTQRSVSMSSTEAEYFATCVIAREVVYFRELLSDLRLLQSGPTEIFTDNKGVVSLSLDPIAFKKTKHILRAAEYVRDLASRQVIVVKWISAQRNVADLCTKSVALVVFRSLMSYLSRLCDLP